MLFIKKYQKNIKRLLNLLSGIGALSLAGIVLLNLPFIYELSTTESVITFILVSLVLFILIFLSFKAFVYPNLLSIIKKRNIAFILFLFIFLSIIITVSSNYIWTTPEVYAIEICFDADDALSPLVIQNLTHPITNRLYPPDSFGFTRYPITIESGQCVNGQITTLLGRQLRYTHDPHLAVTVRQDTPLGRFFISVNDSPSVVLFEDNGQELPTETIKITGGSFIGSPRTSSLSRLGFYGTRLMMIVLSSITLSLFLFGLTERTFSYSPGEGKSNKVKQIIKNIKIKQPPTHEVLLVFVLIYFFLFGLMMTHIGGQPDTGHHTHFSNRFSETWGIPEEDLQSSFTFTGQPYLYYWIVGAVTKISQIIFPANPPNPGLLWRVTSLLMSTATVYYLFKLTAKVTGNPYAGVITAFFLSNTLMFVFISGGVNYDNLMNLASMASIYHLVKIYKNEDFVRNTSFMGLWLSFAAITKEQSLLLTFLLFVFWIFYIITNFTKIRLHFNKRNLILIGLLVFGITLFLGLYGVNYIRYARLRPGCRTFKPAEVCTRFEGRTEDYSPIDFQHLWFIRNYFPENPFYYSLNFWFPHFLKSTWGIISHNTFVPMLSTAFHGVLVLWSFLAIARYWTKEDTIQSVLIFILGAYLVYLFGMNYSSELQTNFLHYGIQGRYAFPVIGIFIAITINYFLKISSETIKRLTISFAIILFFAGGLGVFLFRYSEVFVHWRIFL